MKRLADSHAWRTRRIGRFIVWEFEYFFVTRFFHDSVSHQTIIGKVKQ